MSVQTQTYQIECTLPNGAKRKVFFCPQRETKNGKEVDWMELQRHLYKELQNDNITPTKQYFIIHSTKNTCLHFVLKCFMFIIMLAMCFWTILCITKNAESLIHQSSNSESVRIDPNKPLKVTVKNYNAIYFHDTKVKTKVCGGGHYKPNTNEVAFAVSRATHFLWVFFLFTLVVMALWFVAFQRILDVGALDDDSSIWAIFGMIWAMIWAMMISLQIGMGICYGNLWLIFKMNTNSDDGNDEIYLTNGFCNDRCFCCKKYRYQMDDFKGIRLQKSKKDNLENDKGNIVKLVANSGDKTWNKFIGKVYDMSYYEMIKFFRERYPHRDDVHFSLPHAMKLRLRNVGFIDGILNESWKGTQWVELEVCDNNYGLINNEGGTVMTNDVLIEIDDEILNKVKNLIVFIKNENKNDLVVVKECDDVMNVLDIGNDKLTKQIIDYYCKIKEEYDGLFPEKESNFVQKNEYGKKIMTLLAFKAKEYDLTEINEGNNENRNTILVSKPVKETIKSSLLSDY